MRTAQHHDTLSANSTDTKYGHVPETVIEPACHACSLKVTISLTFHVTWGVECSLGRYEVTVPDVSPWSLLGFLLLFLILGLEDGLILLRKDCIKSFRQIVCFYIKCFQ